MFNIHREEIDWGGRKLVLETGRVARQADGAVVATYGETVVLATAVGMTAPKQEKWVAANVEVLPVAVIGSIGAVFDYYLAQPAAGGVVLTISDRSGKTIREFTSDVYPSDPTMPNVPEYWLMKPTVLPCMSGVPAAGLMPITLPAGTVGDA